MRIFSGGCRSRSSALAGLWLFLKRNQRYLSTLGTQLLIALYATAR